MTRILDSRFAELGSNSPVVGFETDPGSPILRFLTLGGERAYQLSWSCGTCGLIFERFTAAQRTVSIDRLRERLSGGLQTIDESVVEAFSSVLPKGLYFVALIEVHPQLVKPGGPNDYFSHEYVNLFGLDPPHYDLPYNPKTLYYRSGTTPLSPVGDNGESKSALFEFIVPMISMRSLNPATLDQYRLRDTASRPRPTAVAISVLDIQAPAVHTDGAESDPKVTSHWGWTHFLLDGHHKTSSAAAEGRSLTLLTFTAIEAGLSSLEDLNLVLTQFGAGSSNSLTPQAGPPGAG